MAARTRYLALESHLGILPSAVASLPRMDLAALRVPSRAGRLQSEQARLHLERGRRQGPDRAGWVSPAALRTEQHVDRPYAQVSLLPARACM
jgi:hypothetical protein